jgi:hypothetical protein
MISLVASSIESSEEEEEEEETHCANGTSI